MMILAFGIVAGRGALMWAMSGEHCKYPEILLNLLSPLSKDELAVVLNSQNLEGLNALMYAVISNPRAAIELIEHIKRLPQVHQARILKQETFETKERVLCLAARMLEEGHEPNVVTPLIEVIKQLPLHLREQVLYPMSDKLSRADFPTQPQNVGNAYLAILDLYSQYREDKRKKDGDPITASGCGFYSKKDRVDTKEIGVQTVESELQY